MAREAAKQPELVVISGPHRGLTVRLKGDKEIYVGRSRSAEICLKDDKKVSQLHAKFLPVARDRFILEDLGSTNGTFVNGKRMEQTPIQTGDRVKIGHSLLIYRTDAHDVSPSEVKNALKAEREANNNAEDDWLNIAANITREILTSDNAMVALSEALQSMAQAIGAHRGIALLREASTGAVQRLASTNASQAGNEAEPPLDAELLREVGREENSKQSESGAVAAPLRFGGAICGALYFDGNGQKRHPVAGERRFLELLADTLSLALNRDRQRRAAENAIEALELSSLSRAGHHADLSAILKLCTELYQELASARQVNFIVEIEGGLAVSADEIALNRALDRLCEYVVMIAHGEARVRAQADPSGAARVAFGWQGRGFDAAGLRNLMNPDGVGEDFRFALNHGLDGLLPFCRAALESSGGRITVTSSGLEAGAMIVIALPGAQSEPVPADGEPRRVRRSRTERYL